LGLNDWLSRTWASYQADVWWCFEHLPPNFIPTYIRKKFFCKKRIVVDWCDLFSGGHNQWGGVSVFQKIEKFFEEYVRFLGDFNTCINSQLCMRLCDLGISENTIEVIRETTNPDKMTVRNRNEAREKLNLREDEFVIFGFYEHTLVDLLLKEYCFVPTKDWHIYVSGRKECEFPTSCATYLGYLKESELNLWMSACDAFALPLYDNKENQFRFPHKFSHYCCYAKPIIFSPVGDLKMCLDKNMGVSIDASFDGLVGAIESLIGFQEEVREEMGQSCLRFLESDLSLEKVRSQVSSLVERALNLS
jgi:glycosyltransferase involved in cell wall biosynthesis